MLHEATATTDRASGAAAAQPGEGSRPAHTAGADIKGTKVSTNAGDTPGTPTRRDQATTSALASAMNDAAIDPTQQDPAPGRSGQPTTSAGRMATAAQTTTVDRATLASIDPGTAVANAAAGASNNDGSLIPSAATDEAKSTDSKPTDKTARDQAATDQSSATPAVAATASSNSAAAPDLAAVAIPVPPAPPANAAAAVPTGTAPVGAIAGGAGVAGTASPAGGAAAPTPADDAPVGAPVTKPDAGAAPDGAMAPPQDVPAADPKAGKEASGGPLPTIEPQAAVRPKPQPPAAVVQNNPSGGADEKGAETPTAAPALVATAAPAGANGIRIEPPPAPTAPSQPGAAASAQNLAVTVPAAIAPVPAMLTPAAATAAPPAGNAVPIAGLAVEIATRAQDGQRSFEIRLDPPDLGRIDVQLNVDNSGHVTSHLVADRPDTLDLLKRDAPSLERALQSAGLKTDDGGMQFSLRDQSLAGGQQPPRDSNSTFARIVVPDQELPPVDAAVRGYGRLAGLGSGVDIRV